MTKEQIFMTISIVVYLAVVVAIGIRFSRRNKDTDDFYLGGRKLGPFVTAMSAEASDMSSWLLMGLPGLAYLTGCADPFWTALGLGIGTYLNWLIVAKKLRNYTEICGNSITLPEFFSNRFRDKRHILMGIAAIIIIIFFIPYTASGFAACGKLFNSLFGVDYVTAMVVSAIVIVAYTTLGGFLAASTTDFLQSIIMTIALVVVLGFGINAAGGLDQVIANGQELAGYLSVTQVHDPVTNTASPYGALTAFSMLAWGLGYFGMPHILLRFMAIEDREKIKLSRRIATVWVFISMAIAIFIGVIGYGMYKAGALGKLEGSASETIIVQIANLIATHGVLAALIGGLILAGMLAATMSTADSQLLTAASGISQNLIKGVFGVNVSKKTEMIIARISVVCISVVGVFLARNPDSSVFNIVSFAWAGFGAAFGPVVLTALFWKRTNMWGALAGMIAGGVMVFVWKYLIRPLGGLLDIYELLPAFLVAVAAIIVVSLLTPKPSEDIVKEFETVNAIK